MEKKTPQPGLTQTIHGEGALYTDCTHSAPEAVYKLQTL